MKQRILALDIGTVRIGTAICDEMHLTCRSLENVTGSGKREMLEGIVALVKRENPICVVVGIPLNMDGSEGPMAKKARKFVNSLRELLEIPIETMDERLTTKEAQNILISADVRRDRRKHVVDGLAATIILRKYLDKQHRKAESDEST